jgi:hypothetical protein
VLLKPTISREELLAKVERVVAKKKPAPKPAPLHVRRPALVAVIVPPPMLFGSLDRHA